MFQKLKECPSNDTHSLKYFTVSVNVMQHCSRQHLLRPFHCRGLWHLPWNRPVWDFALDSRVWSLCFVLWTGVTHKIQRLCAVSLRKSSADTKQHSAWMYHKLIVQVYDVEEPPCLSSPDAHDPLWISRKLWKSHFPLCDFFFQYNNEDKHAGGEKKI